ncbi:MAG: hypothetical protein ABEH64_04350 [Salinirussus sp.]
MAIGTATTDMDSLVDYLREGLRIAAIMLVWSLAGTVVTLAIGSFGRPGALGPAAGAWLGTALVAAGFLNAVLYVVFRSIDYWGA